DIDEKYTPFGHSDYQTIVADVKKFAAGGKTAVVSTINGDSNVPFYKELGNAGLKAKDVPVVAFSVGEEELRGVDTKPLVGHLAAWNYFMSIKNPANDEFTKKWAAYAKAKNIAGHKDTPLTNDPMEATYIGINMWKQAVEKAKSTDTDKVIAAMAGQTFKAPSGIVSKMDEENHHLHKVSPARWTRKTTTCTSRCSLARSRPMASSTWSGKHPAPSKPSHGAPTSLATTPSLMNPPKSNRLKAF
ncbi:MAG: Aliphatic amidase expression-regulating protein, partial [Pseudomonadota bacterium]